MSGSLTPTPDRIGSRPEAWFVLLGAATAVVVAGVVAAGLALTGGDAGPAAVLPQAVPAGDDESRPGPTLGELTPVGKYRMTRSLVSSTYDVGVPRRDTAVWRFVLEDCRGDRLCTGRVDSSSGSVFDYAWDGSRLRVTAPQGGRVVEEGPCLEDGTGLEVAGSLGRVAHTVAWSPMAAVDTDRAGVPVRLEGGQRLRSTYEGLANCSDAPEARARYRTTLVRLP
jgi:serine/threonine-protein kinase